VVYFDRQHDAELHQRIAAERNRLIQKMLAEKKKGSPVDKVKPTRDELWNCEDMESGHQHGTTDNQ